MGAENYAPSTSVDRGSDFVPAAMIAGQSDGIADHLAFKHRAPGEATVHVIAADADALPDPATANGRLLRVIDGDPDRGVLAVSDGTAWHALVKGDAL